MPESNAPSEAVSLPKQYRPADHEPRIWSRWVEARAFEADPKRVLSGEAKPYCILMPPPNVTAALHLGHALNNTIQDILIRAHRMMGFEALWMPGADHAGIATQTVVDKRLRDEGKPALADYKRKELAGENGREQFIALVQAWKDEYGAKIKAQSEAIGCGADWRRYRFTMDDVCARAVREAFFRLFRDGLIYRGKRLVNWDPVTQTALADDEVEMKEVEGKFYYLRYPLVRSDDANDPEEPITPVTWGELARRGYPGAAQHADDDLAWVTVATTRPETYLGDTAVAVNPNDPRAAALRGYRVRLPLVGRIIPIIEDDYVVLPDPDSSDPKAKYATGFLKVTPAHDPNDYELGRRHEAEIIEGSSTDTVMVNVMAPDASISDQHGWTDVGDAHIFVGKSREEARTLVVREFQRETINDEPLLEATKPYSHSVGHSYRSHVPIEPYLSDQWYCKVTDDTLRGSAQRALVATQRTDTSLKSWPESAPSPHSGGMGVPPVSSPSRRGIPAALTTHSRHLPHWQLGGSTYFITFRLLDGELSTEERKLVLDACFHWDSNRAIVHLVTVMPDHVHMLVTPLQRPDGDWHAVPDLLHSIKSFTAHEINKRRGSKGTVWMQESFDRIVRDEDEFREKWTYMMNNPVKSGLSRTPEEYAFTKRGEGGRGDGRDAHTTKNGERGDAAMTFYPERYAKTYETWHDNLRDWCISRQLWWGHRIPVWTRQQAVLPAFQMLLGEGADDRLTHVTTEWTAQGCAHFIQAMDADQVLEFVCVPPNPAEVRGMKKFPAPDSQMDEAQIVEALEAAGFVQDPDVLDTWFSSALWPLSTMGWPDAATASSLDPGSPDDFKSLLPAFNPTSVLTTAREIITLWVSRMVMFNRYFLPSGGMGVPPVSSPSASSPALPHQATPQPKHGRDAHTTTTQGPIPFRDVFIHAMIQDGEGRKMSKSLGNGVDPFDIIASHGADAMRFTLAKMTTQTQDVRMPVVLDESTGKNTSPKFDEGRNFCNKLWNAARFTLSMLSASSSSSGAGGFQPPSSPFSPADLSLADRWMLSRLETGVREIEGAIQNYQFSAYALSVYDLLWRDFCDWYLEAIKPQVATDPGTRATLRVALDVILRLLHPITPFVTEAIHERLRDVPMPTIDGVRFAATKSSDTLCQSGWPEIDPPVRNEAGEAEFEWVRSLVRTINETRAAHQVEPRRRITLHVPDTLARQIASTNGLVETLAGLASVTTDAAPSNAAVFTFETGEHHLSDLADAIDASAERERLEKQKQDLIKSIGALTGRLSNPGYVDKAPEHLVNQTRQQLEQAKGELATVEAALEKL